MRKSIGIVVFLLFAGLAVAAQDTVSKAQGTITGRVTDPKGAVWPGATITLSRESEKNDEVQRTATNSEGDYSFASVPFGIFRLRITVSGINREFTRRIELNSSKPVLSDVVFSFAPCSDEEELTEPRIASEDHAQIVRSLVGILIGDSPAKPGERRIILSPDNFSADWLSSEQLSRVSILTRIKIQELTEKSGELTYYTITKPFQRGRCVGISIVNNITVKGQLEDANMAGGDDTYEFRKVDGKWTWLHLSSAIS